MLRSRHASRFRAHESSILGRTRASQPVDPRWEPGAGNPPAGFCPGGGPKGPSLPGPKVAIPAGDRDRLERLCRYLARPPIAQDRLTALADGRLRYELKKPWLDGKYAIVLEPLELLTRLAAMVPPPRFHMIRFHGVVSSHSSLRSLVVPGHRRIAA